MARDGDAGAQNAERDGRGRRDRRRRGNRGEPRADRAADEGAATVQPVDALTAAPTHPSSPAEMRHEDSVQTFAAPREVPPVEPQDFDSAPVIASPFYEPVAETVRAVPIAPIEHAPAPIEHAPAPIERAPAPIERAPAPVAAAPEPEPKPAPIPEPKPVVIPRPIPELPPVSLALPPDSGLELVETRFKAAPNAEAESAVPAGPRRVRPPKVAIAEEPLQIVETQRTPLPPAS